MRLGVYGTYRNKEVCLYGTYYLSIFSGETKDVFPHEDAVYGLSADPTNPSVFVSACDDGRLLIYDTRDSTAGMLQLWMSQI